MGFIKHELEFGEYMAALRKRVFAELQAKEDLATAAELAGKPLWRWVDQDAIDAVPVVRLRTFVPWWHLGLWERLLEQIDREERGDDES